MRSPLGIGAGYTSSSSITTTVVRGGFDPPLCEERRDETLDVGLVGRPRRLRLLKRRASHPRPERCGSARNRYTVAATYPITLTHCPIVELCLAALVMRGQWTRARVWTVETKDAES